MNSFWAQRTPSERRMMVICLLFVAIGLPMLLFPGGGGSKKLLSAKEARLKYDDVVRQKAALDRDADRLKPQIAKLSYPDAPEKLMPKVVLLLQKYAKQSGLHLREIKPLRPKRYPTVTKETLSVRFTAPFSQAVPFFYRIDDPSGKLVVEKFDVTSADPKSRTVDVDAQVALYTVASAGGSTAGAGGSTDGT